MTEGIHAAKAICRTVTKEAISTTNTGMRTMSGVTFLMTDTATLEQMSTNVVAKPMDKPFTADVVVARRCRTATIGSYAAGTARVGHMPRRRTNVGFSFNSPLSNIFRFFIFIYIVFFYFIIITCRFFALQDKSLASAEQTLFMMLVFGRCACC